MFMLDFIDWLSTLNRDRVLFFVSLCFIWPFGIFAYSVHILLVLCAFNGIDLCFWKKLLCDRWMHMDANLIIEYGSYGNSCILHKKWDERLVIFESGFNRSLINSFLTNLQCSNVLFTKSLTTLVSGVYFNGIRHAYLGRKVYLC